MKRANRLRSLAPIAVVAAVAVSLFLLVRSKAEQARMARQTANFTLVKQETVDERQREVTLRRPLAVEEDYQSPYKYLRWQLATDSGDPYGLTTETMAAGYLKVIVPLGYAKQPRMPRLEALKEGRVVATLPLSPLPAPRRELP